MKSCIVCGSTDNLNTQMTITIDNQKIVVEICDEHAEDTTVKIAREKYQDRQIQINALFEQAKKLGLDPSVFTANVTSQSTQVKQEVQSSPAAVEVTDTKQETLQTQKEVKPKQQPIEDEEGWISTSKYESVENKGYTSVGGQGAQSYSSYKISGQEDILDQNLREGKVKMGLAEGRAGNPIPIAQERRDGTGVTRIRIVKSENDQSLQRRFKEMANSQDSPPDFRHGYGDATRTCPICRGDCVVNGKDCPKCQGSGLISII